MFPSYFFVKVAKVQLISKKQGRYFKTTVLIVVGFDYFEQDKNFFDGIDGRWNVLVSSGGGTSESGDLVSIARFKKVNGT